MPTGAVADGDGTATTVAAMAWRPPVALRRILAHLPLTGAYERRIAALTATVSELDGEVHGLRRRLEQLEAGLWVPPGHFYSPLPDLDEIQRRASTIFGAPPDQITGVDLDLDRQCALTAAMAPLAEGVGFATTADEAAARGQRYWSDNPSFGLNDALALTLFLRHHRPRRFIELGTGFSSACTLDIAERWLDGALHTTFVDPFPAQFNAVTTEADRRRSPCIPLGTQDVDLSVFADLGAGDVLFIDSTHVARTGSDVNRIFFEIIPSLAPGVLIHLHDIFPGFEYPLAWVLEGRGWNEAYLLRAFLQYNDAVRVYWWPSLLAALDVDQHHDLDIVERLAGGSIWLERR